MALAAARDVGIDVRPGVGLPIVGAREGARGGRRGARRRRGGGRAADGGGRGRRPKRRRRRRRGAAVRRRRASLVRDPPARGEAATRKQGDARPKKPDRVFLPHAKDAIPIRPSSAEMFVLQALRDEAHRFAVSFHRGQRRRLTLRSALSRHPRHRAGPPAPAAAPLRQHQARPRGVGRRAGRRARHEPLGRRGRRSPTGPSSRSTPASSETAAVLPNSDAEEQHAEEQAIDAAFADGRGRPRASPPPECAIPDRYAERQEAGNLTGCRAR